MTKKDSKNNKKINILFLAIIAVVAFAVFANSLSGEFVYDDKRQIARNPLIKDTKLFGTAVTSDVWAFKGDGTIAASNYWRPTFTVWSIINYQFFGLDAYGWHFLNVLLQVLVCLLIFLLLQRWGLSETLAFAITLIFAVHPVHTESVAWIADSPDILFSLFLLSSFWFTQNYLEKQSRFDIALAVIFYALALGAKEVALLCLPIYWLLFSDRSELSELSEKSQNSRKDQTNFIELIPFIAVAGIYFFARLGVIGQFSLTVENAPGFGNALLTAPLIFVFYLKQIIFPLSLGPNYSIRAVEVFSVSNLLIPLIISSIAIYIFYFLSKRSFIQKLGLAIFILPLLSVFNITAFPSEQLVHDRYLYLPLLGFLMMIFPSINELVRKFNTENASKIILAIAVILGILLFIKTWSYNTVWQNDQTLWMHSVTIDSKSAFNYSQLGAILAENGKNLDAIKAYNNSLDIAPSAAAYMGRARSFLTQKKYEEAIWDLKTITEMPAEKINVYTLYQSYEALAIAYSNNGKLNEAEASLIEARKRMPIYYAALTGKLAVILYQKGEKQKALAELEKTQNQARVEMLPESKTVLFRLGALYFEAKQAQKAKLALQEYLRLTNTMQDQLTLANRKQAAELLKKIG